MPSTADPKFERLFARVSPKQAEDDYANALAVLGESIVPAATDSTLMTALHIAQVLICNPPEGELAFLGTPISQR